MKKERLQQIMKKYRDCYDQLHGNKMDNLEEMDRFLEKYNLLGLNQDEIEIVNNPAQFSHSVVSDSLQPHEPQQARPPCPSPTPRVHPNPCLLCWCCHPTISSSVIPFSSCPQSFPASGSFQMNQLSTSGGQTAQLQALKLKL